MADEQKKIVPINYTHREFSSIRQDLLELAERLYPNTFKDWSEASFGALMVDAVAYVGDQLSFYLDYNVNESFLDTAYQSSNIIRHGRALGYKYEGRPSTYGQVAMFVLVPVSSTGIGPDTNYVPVVKQGTRFTSKTGLSFILTQNVDFADSKNPVVVASVDTGTGAPTYYAIKAYGNVVSGQFSQEKIKVGAYQQFLKLRLASNNIAEIFSIVDSEGNEYYEVDYLAQDMVLKQIANTNYQNDNVPSILKPLLVSRKFVVEKDIGNTFLQFGSGKAGETNVVANPQSVAVNAFGKDYVTDVTFDPTRLTKNQNLGIVPSNTTLTIQYRVTNVGNSNVTVGAVNSVAEARMNFADASSLTTSTMQTVIDSLEVSNDEPIIGDGTLPSATEIKRRIFDTFPTQNRAVTQADYENIVYRMPLEFGSIRRCSVQKDPNAQKRNLNLYVVSEDSAGKLIKTNDAIKNNVKTWLNQYRMLNDTIDILDPYILNFGINFTIKAATGVDKFTLLNSAINALATKYTTAFYIGEPFYISDIYSELKGVQGLLDVLAVRVFSKTGASYSEANIDINANLSPDGSYVVVPANALVEIKFPSTDITGKVV
tara:strand:- start:993 stop:2789 length:1797 start_codon:yes stop_codon:yes gene_type:complete